MPESEYLPEALNVYRRTLGDAADNEPVLLAGDVFADMWLEELEAYRARAAADGSGLEYQQQLGEARDFAEALKLLDAAETEVVYVGRPALRRSARARLAWSFGTA